MDILIVEDDPDLGKLLGLMLAAQGYTCVAVKAVDEALAELRQRSFGLILLDLLLPGHDGLELLAAMREACEKIPVLVVTGVGDPAPCEAALALGAQEILRKPFALEDLSRAVRRWLAPSGLPDGSGADASRTETFRPSLPGGDKELEALAEVAHTLKNLLAIALGQVEFLLSESGGEDPEVQRESLESIRQVVLDSGDLIRQLEGCARALPGVPGAAW